MKVTLTPREVWIANAIGGMRQFEAVRKNLPDKYGCSSPDGWGLHIEGCAGEIAAARVLDRYWSPSVNTFKTEGDVGSLQVRTRSNDGYDLIVREDDGDNDLFVLVLGKIPEFEVVGWIRGADAKRSEWLNGYGGRPPAYFAPRSALHPLAELKAK